MMIKWGLPTTWAVLKNQLSILFELLIYRENDVKFIVGERRVKLRTEPLADDGWIEKITHDALIDIRKRYDAIRR